MLESHNQLLGLVRTRKGAGQRFGHGFTTADRYAQTTLECVGPGVCKNYFNTVNLPLVIKDAAGKLVYCGDNLRVEKLATSESEIRKELGDGGELPAHTMLLIKHVLTTPREDRDNDVLETSGAHVDLKMPLLWQHIHTLPIGKLFKVLEQNKEVLRMASVLLDLNDLTSDAAKLVEADALRFSHGFRALKFTEMTKGFRVTDFEIIEESLVSVPSNVDAEVELFSRGKLKSDPFKAHAKALRAMMPKKFAGIGKSFGDLKAAVDQGAISVESATELSKAMLTAPACGCEDKGNCSCQKTPDVNVSTGGDVFATEIDAEMRGSVLGCLGAHQLADGTWMPCANPQIYQDYAGTVPSLPALVAPHFTVSTEPSNKSYERGATVKLGDGKQGVVALVYPGPVYDVTINGGETRSRLLESELTLVQGADNGAYGEMTSNAKPRIKSMAGIMRKLFDPATERLEPCTTEVDWAARFIGCGVKDLSILHTGCGGIMRGGFMDAFEKQYAQSRVAETRNMGDNGIERPPVHEAIDVSGSRRQTFLTEGIRFIVGQDGWKFAYRTWNGHGGQYFALYTDDKDRGQKLIDNAWELLDHNNPLKGEAFGLTTGFLKRNGLDFDEIFLGEKNEKGMKRIVRVVNQKGAAMANKGVILQGPPGTGKTLGARVIMNQAKATYIWVAAKDFWTLGEYSCFSSAFDLARKLAPSIILFEDVDNFVNDYTADLLKGEMDGLSQSSGVTTLLTTNFPEKLPSALIDRPGRFHDVFEFHLPTKDIRTVMLNKWAFGATNKSIDAIAEKTDGLSGAHIFELAAFAKTIRDEDEIDIDAALVKALAKVHEQRELINQNQLAGSSYRHNRRAFKNVVVTGVLAKAGRVLAQRNVDRLQDVHDNLVELEKMTDLQPKAAKVMAKDCRLTVKAIMDECSKPDADTPEETSTDAAVKSILSTGDPVKLKRIRDAADAILEVQKSDKQVAQYKQLAKKTPAPRNVSAVK